MQRLLAAEPSEPSDKAPDERRFRKLSVAGQADCTGEEDVLVLIQQAVAGSVVPLSRRPGEVLIGHIGKGIDHVRTLR